MASRTDENPATAVRRAAMNLLARREQSFHELSEKLILKFPDFALDDVILPALEKLRDENLQSDARFVQDYVRYRYTRGFGPLKIRMELGQKGVDSQLITAALNAAEIDWVALCRQAMVKKFGDNAPVSVHDRDRQYRFLGQRGFDGEQIRLAWAATD